MLTEQRRRHPHDRTSDGVGELLPREGFGEARGDDLFGEFGSGGHVNQIA